MVEDGDKTIRVIVFSGKQADWQIWSAKFLARARRKQYKKILVGEVILEGDKYDESIEKESLKKWRELNDIAYEDLILSMEGNTEAGKVAFQIVRGARSELFKEGDAALAWKRLRNKYESKSAPSRLNLKNKFVNSKLKTAREDPDVWLTNLESLRVQLAEAESFMTDTDLIEHVLNNLPKEYENVVLKLEDRVGAKENPLTIEELREALNLRFERMNGNQRGHIRDEKDAALFAGGFKGRCVKCGKYRHKGIGCRVNTRNKKQGNNDKYNNKNRNHMNNRWRNNRNESNHGQKGNFKCYYCGQEGHKSYNCSQRKQDEQEGKLSGTRNKMNEDMANSAQDIERSTKYEFDRQSDVLLMITEKMTYDQAEQLLALRGEESEDEDLEDRNSDMLWDCVKLAAEYRTNPEIPEDKQQDWAYAVYEKLEHIRINCVEEVQFNIFNINQLLRQKRCQRFLYSTIKALHEASIEVLRDYYIDKISKRDLVIGRLKGRINGLEIRLEQCRQMYEKVTNNQPEEEEEEEEEIGDCMNPDCNSRGVVHTLCDECGKDTGCIYDRKIQWKEEKMTRDDVALPTTEFKRGRVAEKNLFIADSGASCHMVHSDQGMFDTQEIDDEITVGNGNIIRATKIGKWKGILKMPNGIRQEITLDEVKYVPSLAPYNLLSLTKAISRNWKIGNQGKVLTIEKDKTKIYFDKLMATRSGFVCATVIEPQTGREIAQSALHPGQKINTEIFHKRIGHVSETSTRNTAHYYGITLTGKLPSCEECALAKAKQKSVSKVTPNSASKKKGERLYMDISSIRTTSFGGAKFWLLVVDEATDFCWSFFMKNKSDTTEHMITLLKTLQGQNINVKLIRCDNTRLQDYRKIRILQEYYRNITGI